MKPTRGHRASVDTEEARQAGRKGGRAHSREQYAEAGAHWRPGAGPVLIARRADLACRQPLQPDELQRADAAPDAGAQAIFVQVALLTALGAGRLEALRPEHIDDAPWPGRAAPRGAPGPA